jgi:hypothetical protein
MPELIRNDPSNEALLRSRVTPEQFNP